MVESGKRWLAKGETGTSKTPLIVIRLVCQKGVDEWGKLPNKEDLADTIDALFFPHNIATMARFIQNLGSAAIESKETDFLYRVFEAFGWLGCSALKAGNHEVTCVCVRGLAQLGREARVKKLECHWDQCAVKPEDHARERIEWIATWISKVEKDQQEPWIGIVSQGFSRLAGKIVEVKMPETNGDTIMRLNITEEDHVEGFSSNAGGRDLDYSDFSMLKDFGLHGFMGGTLMQGPVIPFVTSPTESPP